MTRLERLRRMSRDEVTWRGRALARINGDRLRVRVSPPSWNRDQLCRVLEPRTAALVRSHVAREDWSSAHEDLAHALLERAPRFVLDPSSPRQVRNAILERWPAADRRAAARADRVMRGEYDLLGYRRLTFARAGQIDWHFDPVHRRSAPRVFWADVPYLDPAIGDHKVIWELNRHQHWLALGRALWLTGDYSYARTIVDQLEDWLAANPPLVGINWASMLEIGFRSISWTWALHALLAHRDALTSDTPWLVDMLIGLDRQMNHVEGNLSYYFSPNTHLTGEALALYVVGSALPELASSARWADTGRRVLLDEIDRQIAADGGHAERSTHYQRYTLDFYLLALRVAERGGDSDAVTRFTDAVLRLAEFTRTVADEHGRLPLIGDDDGGMLWPVCGREPNDVRDSLALAAVVLGRADLAPWGLAEEVLWVAGDVPVPAALDTQSASVYVPSRAFADTGYVVSRDEHGGHLVFDAGAHGYLNGGHAHADALSITLSLRGRPLLIDPGTSTYTMDARLRDRMRSTANHNTLLLDGAPQSSPNGPFHWRTRADARLAGSRHNRGFDWAEGWHGGYGDARHRRSIYRSAGGGWLVVDEVLGRGRHRADLHWHFDPAWMVARDSAGRLHARHFEGDAAWLLHDGDSPVLAHADETTGLGWCAPAYGTLLPTWTARVSREAAAPFSMATWIAPADPDESEPPTLERQAVECDPAAPGAVAVRVTRRDLAIVTLLRPGEPARRETRSCAIGDYQTNGRVLQYATNSSGLAWLDLVDASHVLALRDGLISVACDDTVGDLHLALTDGTLDIWSSIPPARLRLQGAAVAAAARVRLNGRDASASARERADVVVARPESWGEPRPAEPRETDVPAPAMDIEEEAGVRL